eukprot:TRINITY_DN5001_c0_g2_i1.p1 TRINITY_DN5001_c0_g2~~TRINITY_DN5001_c0_g2_i1.p1  ORF type:complete len:155 (-),score=23.85 TRINITY_DN5001_c0_g2_i1:123-587(-)
MMTVVSQSESNKKIKHLSFASFRHHRFLSSHIQANLSTCFTNSGGLYVFVLDRLMMIRLKSGVQERCFNSKPITTSSTQLTIIVDGFYGVDIEAHIQIGPQITNATRSPCKSSEQLEITSFRKRDFPKISVGLAIGHEFTLFQEDQKECCQPCS